MSLVAVHLRWNDVRAEQYEHICRALPDGGALPAGCLSRRRRREGRAVLATEVWCSEQEAGRFLAGLPDALGPAGLGEPQLAVFAVPDVIAPGYGPSSVRTAAPVRGPAAVPGSRRPASAPLSSAAGSSR